MLQPGDLFENQYVIERELGQGAFAVVYLAREQELGRHVAIKVLKEGRSDDRFFREAKLLGELRSPHTVTMIDVGRSGPEQRPFMVFEYVPGETLEERLARVGAMPGGRVAHIIRQVLASLAEAHERGIVHRDVKPANIMMTDVDGDQDFVKVLDFGVAKPLEEVRDVSVELTMAGQIIGTMRYMAPEQLKGQRKAVPASDVYAVGLIAYELLTAEKAASGDDAHYVLAQHLSPDPFILSDRLDVPFQFKRAFEAMMSKDVKMRPRDAGEALRTLEFQDDDPTTFDQRMDVAGVRRPPSGPNPYPQGGFEQQRPQMRPGSGPLPHPRTADESLRIDVQALEENRKRVTRGVRAIPDNPDQEEDLDVSTIFYVAVALVVFAALIFLLTQLSQG